LNAAAMVQKSSVRAIVEASGRPLSELIRGPNSLGALLAARGYRAVPSPPEPDPDGQPYFSGGYNTDRHGSGAGGTVSGVQFEHPFAGVRGTPAERAAYTSALVDVLDQFFRVWLGGPLTAPATARPWYPAAVSAS